MANPAWVKGMKAVNPGGKIANRDRFKVVENKTVLERKIATYLTKKWGRMVTDMDKLNEKDRVKAFIELLQYSMPKKAAERPEQLTADQIDGLYEKVMQAISSKGLTTPNTLLPSGIKPIRGIRVS
jgi:hypothetical protein